METRLRLILVVGEIVATIHRALTARTFTSLYS